MAKQSLGALIKEARTGAGLTQEKLAAKISGVSASDISKMERGELVPTQEVLKQIAKATGVTQSSLLEAAKEAKGSASSGKSTSTKSATTKSATTKSTTSKSTSAKSTTSKTSSSGTLTLTATEKKLVEAYRAADSNTKKAAMKVLNGESTSLLDQILGSGTPGSFADAAESLVGSLVSNVLGNLGK